ncbi:hypothetical protein [Brevibacterium jeotgali]|uniref:PH domain-containing protein n=1 Tax=Brevibacterium jeotgali TaxID=1262550 RepID=A0A2H1L7H4_9MICO|nr:hypothetical protein [Brevibacterium jeotgali]TWC03429.1 hypothetical protein FB108_2157 [Brevibacterium jeotgali]SMY12858.1 hypothetical protein BJEO58_02466 [Brevibacterium jeotgali]
MNGHTAPQPPQPQSGRPLPRWAQKRAAKLAEVWGPSRILLAYPRTRLLLLVPAVATAIAGGFFLGFPLVLIAAGESRATVAVGIGLLALFAAVYAAVALLVIGAVRTSILVTDRGIELRQFLRTTRHVRWDELNRVEVQQSGYRTGASVLVLTTGERIVCLATDPRRAVYNGYGIRSFQGPGGRVFSPITAELIDCHRAWQRGSLPRA